MKNIMISFICLIFIFVFCNPVLAQNNEMINYNNEMLGFSLSYPSDWDLEEHMEEEYDSPFIGISITFEDPDDYLTEVHFSLAIMDIEKHGVSTIDELIIKANLDSLSDNIDVITYFGVECYHMLIKDAYSEGELYILIKEDNGFMIGFSVMASLKEEEKRLIALVNSIFESIIIY